MFSTVVMLCWHTCELGNCCHWLASTSFTLVVVVHLSQTVRCLWPLTDVFKLTSICVLCIWVNASVFCCVLSGYRCAYIWLDLVISGTSNNWWSLKSDKTVREIHVLEKNLFAFSTRLAWWCGNPPMLSRSIAVLVSQRQWLELKYFVRHLCRSEGRFYHLSGSCCDSISIIYFLALTLEYFHVESLNEYVHVRYLIFVSSVIKI
jgi:hypothetical protein